MLKTRDAQRTMLMTSLVRAAQGAILISGTPITTRPIDAWSQASNPTGTHQGTRIQQCSSKFMMHDDYTHLHGIVLNPRLLLLALLNVECIACQAPFGRLH